ncbi:hypothetical protein OE88DRAFT_1724093 [Heliocybe sulcata]|uniref:Uncharacterized protein n=1 Tax=Heliocybe sulcata TaxID=5364 RepID=A0A5C3NDD7_9AGAM|nr:hypothetical protein OE88DRAFT_1724093 [Heliocybe sulcata]
MSLRDLCHQESTTKSISYCSHRRRHVRALNVAYREREDRKGGRHLADAGGRWTVSNHQVVWSSRLRNLPRFVCAGFLACGSTRQWSSDWGGRHPTWQLEIKRSTGCPSPVVNGVLLCLHLSRSSYCERAALLQPLEGELNFLLLFERLFSRVSFRIQRARESFPPLIGSIALRFRSSIDVLYEDVKYRAHQPGRDMSWRIGCESYAIGDRKAVLLYQIPEDLGQDALSRMDPRLRELVEISAAARNVLQGLRSDRSDTIVLRDIGHD